MPKPPPDSPTRADLEGSVGEIIRIIYQCSAYYVWYTRIRPKLADERSAYRVIAENSFSEATLLNVRRLNDSFSALKKTRVVGQMISELTYSPASLTPERFFRRRAMRKSTNALVT